MSVGLLVWQQTNRKPALVEQSSKLDDQKNSVEESFVHKRLHDEVATVHPYAGLFAMCKHLGA